MGIGPWVGSRGHFGMLAVIVNPIAGGGAGKTEQIKVLDALKERRIAHRLMVSEYAGHTTSLASEAVETGADGIVAIGGDGTIFEIVNGLKGRKTTLYFVPCGTGNDFVRMLDLPNDPVEALKSQLSCDLHDIDVGQVGDRYFLNVSGCGFDVEVLKLSDRYKRFGKGLIPYFMGLIAALKNFKPLSVELTVNGQTTRTRATIISVGNGRYFGGGMKPTPHAQISDGRFDLIYVDPVSKLTILRLLSKFIPGKHTTLPIVHELRCDALTIRCKGMTVNLDGELIDMDCANYRILPGALTIRAKEKP